MEIKVDELKVEHNLAEARFEVALGDGMGLLEYRIRDGRMTIHHTEVPRAYESRGIAAKMTRAALAFAEEQKLLVVPRCPYTAYFFARHKEFQHLLAPSGM